MHRHGHGRGEGDPHNHPNQGDHWKFQAAGPRGERIDLAELAKDAMASRGLQPEFPADALRHLATIAGAASPNLVDDSSIRDLRSMLWASIDNDDSRDLDQLSVAQELTHGSVRIWVAVADVDALVRKDDPVDRHAHWNTTSVYTAGGIFPMLPEQLSTDMTSLNPDVDRLAVVATFVVDADGAVSEPEIFRAWVHNRAKLAYNAVAAWLDGTGPMPPAMAAVPDLGANIKLQDTAADRLRARRFERGALELETIEAKAVVLDGTIVDMDRETKNQAKELIEDLMIAANQVAAGFLKSCGLPAFRRIVRTPERWDRIVALAAGYDEHLPANPDGRALAEFLRRRRHADPLRFPDVSLAVVKLMGSGEYVLLRANEDASHFGLAVRDYSHSTAPNRRFPDVILQRLIKSALRGKPSPYADEELQDLAAHCTRQEDNAQKVERQVRKSAAALLLSSRVGEEFDALVTGSSQKGVWVRTFHPPVEGKLVAGEEDVDVGDSLRVRLVGTDVRRGFIDYVRVAGVPGRERHG